MNINFSNNTNVQTIVTNGQVTWAWNGVAWQRSAGQVEMPFSGIFAVNTLTPLPTPIPSSMATITFI